LSPVLFCLYVDGLLVALSKAGVGRYIDINFVGAWHHADNRRCAHCAYTASALRRKLDIFHDYAKDYSISFNTSKSNCLIVYPNGRRLLHESIEMKAVAS